MTVKYNLSCIGVTKATVHSQYAYLANQMPDTMLQHYYSSVD